MTRRMSLVRLASAVFLLSIAASASAAVLPPSTDPPAITVSTPTTIKVTSLITDANVLAGSVNVQRLDATGRAIAVLATLRDDGTNGDVLAGDRVYSGSFTLNESRLEPMRLRVSAALRGVLLRPVSMMSTIDVLPQGIPTKLAASDVTKAVVDAEGSRILPDQVIGCFAAGVDIPTIQRVATAIAGTIIGRSPVGNCYQFRLPAGSTAADVHTAVLTMRTFPEVVAAEPVGVHELASVPVTKSPEFVRTRFPHAQAYSRGAGVLVAVVDSGVNYLDPRLAPIEPGLNVVAKDSDDLFRPLDNCGHGTHVAGIVRGTAPSAKILAVKVTDDCNRASIPAGAAGIVAAVNDGARVVNASFGAPIPTFLDAAAVLYAQSRGAVVVAAAGNTNGSALPQFPAAYPGVIAVGNVDSSGQPYATSANGPWINVWAPGVNVPSTGLNGGVASGTGTSFAAPFVAGLAALVWARSGGSADQVVAQVERNVVFPGGCTTPTGVGQLDAFAAVTGVNTIDVAPGEPILASGETETLVATAKDSCDRPTSLPAGAHLRWASDHTQIADIDLDTGVVTGGKRPGAAEISAIETKTEAALTLYCFQEGIANCQIKQIEGEAPATNNHPRQRVEVTVPARVLTVTKAGTGTGAVASDPEGIACDPSCAQMTDLFALSSVVSLSAQASPGSLFAGWGGDCAGTSSSTSVTLADDRACTAQFNPECQTYSGDGSGFPFLMVTEGSATITTTKPGSTSSFTVDFTQPISFNSPQSAASVVLGSAAVNAAMRACNNVFPQLSGSRTDQGGIFRITTTATIGGGTLTVQETGDNTQPANDGNCPANCLTDEIHYVKTWQYDLRTGAYTLTFNSNRAIVSFNPSTLTRIDSVSHNGGTKTGQQTVQIQ